MRNIVMYLCFFAFAFSSFFSVNAAYLTKNFLVTSHFINCETRETGPFLDSNDVRPDKDGNVIFYPNLHYDDKELCFRLNDYIQNFITKFVSTYPICNRGYKGTYRILENDKLKIFSIKWDFKKGTNLVDRIFSLNFNLVSGNALGLDDIFNIMASGMMGKIIELSNGNLDVNTDWDKFSSEVDAGNIQLYAENDKWYIVFNPVSELQKIVYVEVPEYLLKVEDARY